jgi:uncharacterized membrane protein YphA (DoxX/SURF4 family)
MNTTLRIFHWLCRLALAFVFIYSGYVKAEAKLQFAVAISGYRLVPENLILPLATYLPWLEILLGVALLVGWKLHYFAGATAGLLLFFIIVLAITYARGIEADCGCFGFGDRISWKTLLRDSLFLLPALYLLFEGKLRNRLTARAGSQKPEAGVTL